MAPPIHALLSSFFLKFAFLMILGLIILITHEETTLAAIEGQVLITNITWEEDECCQFISNREIPLQDSLVEVNQALIITIDFIFYNDSIIGYDIVRWHTINILH